MTTANSMYGLNYETGPRLEGERLVARFERVKKLDDTHMSGDRRYRKLRVDEAGDVIVDVTTQKFFLPKEAGFESVELRFQADMYGDRDSWRAKRQLRYWCFRLQNEATGGAPCFDDRRPDCLPDLALEFQADVEEAPWFKDLQGWKGFAIVWDLDWVDPANLGKVKRRRRSIWGEHRRDLEAKVPFLPQQARGRSFRAHRR